MKKYIGYIILSGLVVLTAFFYVLNSRLSTNENIDVKDESDSFSCVLY